MDPFKQGQAARVEEPDSRALSMVDNSDREPGNDLSSPLGPSFLKTTCDEGKLPMLISPSCVQGSTALRDEALIWSMAPILP
jgi:hypothetical protein